MTKKKSDVPERTHKLNKYQRGAFLSLHYPNMPEDVIGKAVGDIPTGCDGANYGPAAALLDYDRGMPSWIIATALGCSVNSAYCYRSAYKTWGGDADLMRLATNEKSCISKAKARAMEAQTI